MQAHRTHRDVEFIGCFVLVCEDGSFQFGIKSSPDMTWIQVSPASKWRKSVIFYVLDMFSSVT